LVIALERASSFLSGLAVAAGQRRRVMFPGHCHCRLTLEQNKNIMLGIQSTRATFMPPDAAPNPQADADPLDATADQAIAACGGDARQAVKALLVTNEFLEAQIAELQAAVSSGYARGRLASTARP
jgi:hypothetical protein